LPTRSRRFVVIRPSRNVSFASSAWWIATFVTSPSITSSSSATRPRAMAVRPPDDQLAEQRVVERRHLVAVVQVRIHPHAGAAGGVVLLHEPGHRPEL